MNLTKRETQKQDGRIYDYNIDKDSFDNKVTYRKVPYRTVEGGFDINDKNLVLHEDIESIIHEISDSDTTVYNNLTLDSVLSKKEAIKMYIVITNVCLYGVNKFIKSLTSVKDSYTIQEILALTSNEVGNHTLRKFFKI